MKRAIWFALLALPWTLTCESTSVVAIDVAQVEVTPATLSVAPGGSGQLAARALDADGVELMGRTILWASSDQSVATVSASGSVSAVGSGSATITASTGGVSGDATVSVNVTGQIELSQESVEFETQVGGSTQPQNVQITNSGSGSLTNVQFSVAYDGAETGWLVPSLNQNSTPATLTVATNPSAVGSLGPGLYGATVTITANNASNSPLALPVQLQVSTPDPAIGVSPASRAFAITEGGSSAPNQNVQITNVGGGSLTGLSEAVIGAGVSTWLAASLNRTTAPATLTLSIRSGASGLAVGVYNGTVRIASGAATNSPVDVAVTLTVGEPPAFIGLSRTTVSFTAIENDDSPADETVSIVNLGGGTLSSLTATNNAPWLTSTLSSITAPSTLTLRADVAGLAPGSYSATVTVSSPVATNSPQQITVDFEVLTAAEIVLAASTASFTGQQGGADPAPSDIAITNGGAGALTGLAASVQSYSGGQDGWLSAAIVGGTAAPATLRLTPTIGARTAATLNAVVQVTSPVAGNSPQLVNVTLVIELAPPAAPSGLTRVTGTTSSITISFQDNANNEDGFVVERDGAEVGTPGAETGTGNTVTFVDSGLSAGTQYAYRVWAQNSAGASGDISRTYRTAPAAPTLNTVTATGPTTVDVAWTSNNGNGVEFDVERSATGTGAWSVVGAGLAASATSFTHSGAADGTQHFYRIVAEIPAGESASSNVLSDITPLVAPSGLSATALGPNTVRLTWSHGTSSGGAIEYEVEMNGGLLIGSTSALTADIAGLEDATEYTFRVRAFAPGLPTSGWSGTAVVTTPLAPPNLNVPVSGPDGTTMSLTWDDPNDNEADYEVRWGTASGALTNTESAGAGATAYIVATLTPGTEYFFVVCAIGSGVSDACSSEVSGTTIIPPSSTSLFSPSMPETSPFAHATSFDADRAK
ncbi:MAG: fibronectin type III domain-containing protein [Longimicrobiales bacterium]